LTYTIRHTQLDTHNWTHTIRHTQLDTLNQTHKIRHTQLDTHNQTHTFRHTQLDTHNWTHTIRHTTGCTNVADLLVRYTGNYLANYLQNQRIQCKYNVMLGRFSADIGTVGKNIDNTFCVYEFYLLLASMKCVCAIRLFVVSLNIYYCFTLYNKQHNFLKRLTKCEVFTSNFSINTSENIIILRGIESHMIQYVYWYSVKYPLFFNIVRRL